MASQAGGTLDGVTLAGSLLVGQILNTYVNVKDGLTLAASTITMEGNGALDFGGAQSLGGNGTLNFSDGNTQKGIFVPKKGDTLIIGTGVTIHGVGGTIGSVSAGTLNNNGTIASDGGGSIIVQSFSNFAAGVLTGGTWEAANASTLYLLGANVVANAATLILDGATSHFYSDSIATNALAGYNSNLSTGRFTVQNNAKYTPPSGTFSNAGAVVVGALDAFAATQYVQTGGSTTLQKGTLGSASSATINIQGGTLSGPGTVNGSLTNSGEVDLGSSPGTLIIDGNYSQTAAGTLSLNVGGTTAGSQFDQITIFGSAAFDGTLAVHVTNGFGPSLPQSFTVITANGGSSGAFAVANLPSIDGHVAFAVQNLPGPHANLTLLAAIDSPDLAVQTTAITVNGLDPANASGTTGQSMTVAYTVANLSPTAATGSWTDSVFLSADSTLDASDMLLGHFVHSGTVPGLSSYNGTLTAQLPGVVDGSYHIIVVADSGKELDELNQAHHIGASTDGLPVSTTTLTPGLPVSGSVANGQGLYYKVVVIPGQDLEVDGIFSVANQGQIFASHFAIPTSSAFTETDLDTSTLEPSLAFPGSQGGAYYILVQGQTAAGAGETFTLTARVAPLRILGYTTGAAPTAGLTALNLTGTGFTQQATVRLRNGDGTTFADGSTSLSGSGQIDATFDLSQVPAGEYFVNVVQGTEVATASSLFDNVPATQLVPATVTMSAPADTPLVYWNPATPGVDYYPEGSAWFPISITVSNPTGSPAFSPIIEYGLVNAQGQFVGQPSQYTVANSGGLFPILEPGASEPPQKFIITAVPAFGHEVLTTGVAVVNGDTPLNMSKAPIGISQDAWNAVLKTLTKEVGTTEGQLQTVLQQDSAYLTEEGETVTDPGQALGLEVLKAEAGMPSPAITSSTDLSIPGPGLSLSLSRTFVNTIPGRYQQGSFGYGWSFIGDETATTDPVTGSVYIEQGGSQRIFTLTGTNTYQGVGGDTATLTLDGSLQIAPSGSRRSVRSFSGNPTEPLRYSVRKG